MEIFGKTVQLKALGCNSVGVPGHPIPPSINLFVKVTNGCNAKCPFCSNSNSKGVNIKFNIDKLFEVIDEIQRQGIFVNRVNITGGEPSIVQDIVTEILERAQDENYSKLHLHLNTNGLLPQSQYLMTHSRWNSISMSLHHYDVNRLSCLYGVAIPKNALELHNIDRRKLNVSCNLIRGYVDSKDEVKKMLDFTMSLGIFRIGFVSLLKVNEYCISNFVDYDDVDLKSIPNVYHTQSKDRGKDCKCANYLYNNGLDILEIYMRYYANPYYCESSLLYDGEYLKQGFHQDNIIY
jgi:pyruvate-formate lyase-activating enzyme